MPEQYNLIDETGFTVSDCDDVWKVSTSAGTIEAHFKNIGQSVTQYLLYLKKSGGNKQIFNQNPSIISQSYLDAKVDVNKDQPKEAEANKNEKDSKKHEEDKKIEAFYNQYPGLKV